MSRADVSAMEGVVRRPAQPRFPLLGLIGGPLLLIGNLGVLFDWWDQTGAVSILVIPEFLWELFLGIYAAVWGFRKDAPILSERSRMAPQPDAA